MYNAILREFHSLEAALAAARATGAPAKPHGEPRREVSERVDTTPRPTPNSSKPSVIAAKRGKRTDELRQMARNKPPLMLVDTPQSSNSIVPPPPRNLLSRDEVLARLRARHAAGRSMFVRSLRQQDPLLVEAAESHFGSWRAAVDQATAAAKVKVIVPRSRWTKERVIAELTARDAHGWSLKTSMIRREQSPLYAAAMTHFGSMQAALLAADIPVPARTHPQRPREALRKAGLPPQAPPSPPQAAPPPQASPSPSPVPPPPQAASSNHALSHETFVQSTTARIADSHTAKYLVSIARETPRGMVLVAAMHVEELLRQLLRAACSNVAQTDELLDDGPLGTLYARITTCWCLGLLPKSTYVNVEQIHQLRNYCLRNPDVEDFSDRQLRALLGTLRVSPTLAENHSPLHRLADVVGSLESWIHVAQPILVQHAAPRLLAQAGAERDAADQPTR